MDMTEAEKKFELIEKKLDSLPGQITKSLSETMDLKIENAIQKVKIEFYKWLVPMCIGLIFSLIGVIFSYIK